MEQPAFPKRKSPRLKTFDYNAGGVFCVTVCTAGKQKLFGAVVDGEEARVQLSPLGQVVQNRIMDIPSAYPGVDVLNWVVMPNHLHLLLQIPSAANTSPQMIVRALKRLVTTDWRKSVWQRSFFEHIVRNEQDALRFWKYIDENPKKWTLDPYFE